VEDEQLSKKEIQVLTKLLGKLQPGLLPLDIFLQIARLTVLPILEVVPVRMHDAKAQVLVLPREANDGLWPDDVHVPGTVLRADDKGALEKALERIKKELGGASLGEPVFVQTVFHESKRGWELAFVFWAEMGGEPKLGQYYDLENLPGNIMASQTEFIREAGRHYQAYRTST